MKASILILLTSMFALSAQAETVMYQYTDDNGQKVISSTLPAEAANRGYSIISSRGNVIEKVAPKLTEQQIIELNKTKALEQEQKEQAALAKEKQILQDKKDKMLLKMFTNIDDIERSRNDKVETIEVQQAITRDNILRLEEQLKRTQETIQAHQAQNSPIPAQLQETVEETLKQLEENKQFVISKENEKKDIDQRYETMIERFSTLKGLNVEKKPVKTDKPDQPDLLQQ